MQLLGFGVPYEMLLDMTLAEVNDAIQRIMRLQSAESLRQFSIMVTAAQGDQKAIRDMMNKLRKGSMDEELLAAEDMERLFKDWKPTR